MSGKALQHSAPTSVQPEGQAHVLGAGVVVLVVVGVVVVVGGGAVV